MWRHWKNLHHSTPTLEFRLVCGELFSRCWILNVLRIKTLCPKLDEFMEKLTVCFLTDCRVFL